MQVLGMRFCKVAHKDDARALADLFGKLGLSARPLGGDPGSAGTGSTSGSTSGSASGFNGAVFPIEHNGENSWIEIWPAGAMMPEMTMLQIIVDDADAYADHARQHGLDVKGPDDAHGERIYYLEGPGGLPIAFQSRIAED